MPKQKSFPRKAFPRGYLSNENIQELANSRKDTFLPSKQEKGQFCYYQKAIDFYHRISLQKDSTPVFKTDLAGSYKDHSEMSERKLSIYDEDENSRRDFNPLFNRSFDELNDNDKKEKSDSDIQNIEVYEEADFARRGVFNMSFRTTKLLDRSIPSKYRYQN